MTRIARTVAFSLLIAVMPLFAAQADEVVGSEIAVPTAVVVEEVVTAAPPAFVDLESTSGALAWASAGAPALSPSRDSSTASA